jgi:hypothetical protein
LGGRPGSRRLPRCHRDPPAVTPSRPFRRGPAGGWAVRRVSTCG